MQTAQHPGSRDEIPQLHVLDGTIHCWQALPINLVCVYYFSLKQIHHASFFKHHNENNNKHNNKKTNKKKTPTHPVTGLLVCHTWEWHEIGIGGQNLTFEGWLYANSTYFDVTICNTKISDLQKHGWMVFIKVWSVYKGSRDPNVNTKGRKNYVCIMIPSKSVSVLRHLGVH